MLLTVLIMVGALLTAMTLFMGISSMAHGGDEDQHHSHVLMFQRVGWQALTVVLLLMAMLAQLR